MSDKTRLELLQRLHRRSGIGGDVPSTSEGQTGEPRLLVEYLDTAYEDIQNKHLTWRFLRNDFSISLTSGTQDYATSLVTNFKEWVIKSFRCYKTATGVSDEQYMEYVPWDDFRDTFIYASQRTTQGRPIEYSIKPDKSIAVWPLPNDTYTLVGEYYKSADVMDEDADVPIFPSDYHLLIMWKALMQYGADYEDPTKFSLGRHESLKMMLLLETNQLERIAFGEPLA